MLVGLVMKGSLTMGQCNRTADAAPTRLSFEYVVPPGKSSNTGSSDLPEDLPTPAKISNAARDAKIKALEVTSLFLLSEGCFRA